MRLLDLVEQDDGVGTAADGLGELAALFEADVARRRADEARDGVLLHVLAHVEAHHRVLVVEEKGGEGARQLGLADARRPQEEEAAERPVGVLDAGAGAPDGVGHGADGLVLADDALVQPLLHMDELLDLPFHEVGDGDTRPAAHHLRHVLFVHLLLQEALASRLLLGRFRLRQAPFELREAPVLEGCRLLVVGPALGGLDFGAGGVDLFLEPPYLLDGALLFLPLRLEGAALLLQAGELLFEGGETLLGGRVGLLAQRLAFHLELHDPAFNLVQLHRHAVDLHAQAARRLVDEVDRLVGQEAVCDVAVGEDGRGD